MTIPALLGFLGILIGVTRALPQFVTLLRAREAFGVSVDSAATSSLVSLGWAIYGARTGQPYIMLASGSTSFIFALITIVALRYGRSFREFRVAPVWLTVLVSVGTIFGVRGLGIVMPVSSLASNVPQIWVAYKERNLTDLSIGSWLLALGEGLVWGVYAVLLAEPSVGISAVFQTVTAAAVVLLKIKPPKK
jgi:uncharacterized protein with PQ loop repeat